MTKIKICGITRVDDALLAESAGVFAIGLNFWPEGKRYIAPERAKSLIKRLARRVAVVGVFVDECVDTIEKIADDLNLDWIQLHGNESAETMHRLGPRAFKAVQLRDDLDDQIIDNYATDQRPLLVDSYHPTLPGGTGQVANWARAAIIATRHKLILAGGLNASNVAAAIRTVRPFAVDVASGIESEPGIKDQAKLLEFVSAVRSNVDNAHR